MKLEDLPVPTTPEPRKQGSLTITVLRKGKRHEFPLLDPETGRLHRMFWDEDGGLSRIDDFGSRHDRHLGAIED